MSKKSPTGLKDRIREGLKVLGTECTFGQMKDWLKKNHNLEMPYDSIFYVARNEARAEKKVEVKPVEAGSVAAKTAPKATPLANGSVPKVAPLTAEATKPLVAPLTVEEKEVIEVDTVTDILPRLRDILTSLKGRKDVAKRLIDVV